MKNTLISIGLILLIILTGCSNEIPEQNQPAKSGRTVIAYLAANNNLDQYIMDNVQWMYKGLSEATDTCTLLIYYKATPHNSNIADAEIWEFQTNGLGEINGQPILNENRMNFSHIKEQAKRHKAASGNSVHPQVMKKNLEIMQEISPALCYGLILGSHASGWLPASKKNQGINLFSFGEDQGYGIDIPDLNRVLKESFPKDNLDFILFDACMMGIAEVCYELREITHYCLASVMETPAIGFPYNLILNRLYEDEIDYTNICKTITENNRARQLWGTYAAIDCSKMEQLAAIVRKELHTHKEKLALITPHSIQQYGVNHPGIPHANYTNIAFDIKDLFVKLNNSDTPTSIQQILDEVVVAKDCIDNSKIFPFNEVLTDRNRFCGIGMYIPYTIENSAWNNYYETLEWYRAIGWEDLKEVLVN